PFKLRKNINIGIIEQEFLISFRIDNDAFYDAKGTYSFFYTCNTWANNALKAAGQKAALWTPSDFGIFQHYK
ncbi:DUF2459 domain-containing protein, partial [Chryseobacterium sp. SIMBA_028]|uniref:DUF2459 domain-containing protein n=1 Tax=Chryseobacterium sp. SIMBA_028 TaxID=3085771 RepID=UPI00397BFFFC